VCTAAHRVAVAARARLALRATVAACRAVFTAHVAAVVVRAATGARVRAGAVQWRCVMTYLYRSTIMATNSHTAAHTSNFSYPHTHTHTLPSSLIPTLPSPSTSTPRTATPTCAVPSPRCSLDPSAPPRPLRQRCKKASRAEGSWQCVAACCNDLQWVAMICSE